MALHLRWLRGLSGHSPTAKSTSRFAAALVRTTCSALPPSAAQPAALPPRRRTSLLHNAPASPYCSLLTSSYCEGKLRQRRWASSGSASDGERDLYTPEQRGQDHKHCVEMVRDRDMEGYLCGLLMPSSAREAFFALRAFNVEIASIKDASRLVGGRSRGTSRSAGIEHMNTGSEQGGDAGPGDSGLASRLRMQWWRDAIAEIYERDEDKSQSSDPLEQDQILRSLTSSRKHNPTLRSLACAIRTHGLTHRFLRRMMEAREADLDILQYDALRDVAQYGEDTVSSVLYLSLECVGVRDEATDMVASDIGVGIGVLTALRSTGFRATQGESSIPTDVASKHSVSMDTLWSAWDSSINGENVTMTEEARASKEALRGATREMADVASFHLSRAREKQSAVPKEGRMCLLPAVCGVQYLDSLRAVDCDVLHPSLVGGGDDDTTGLERRRRLSLMFLLGRTWLTGTF